VASRVALFQQFNPGGCRHSAADFVARLSIKQDTPDKPVADIFSSQKLPASCKVVRQSYPCSGFALDCNVIDGEGQKNELSQPRQAAITNLFD